MQSKTRTADAWRSASPIPNGTVPQCKARFLRAEDAIPRVDPAFPPRPSDSRLDWRPVDEHGTAHGTCGTAPRGLGSCVAPCDAPAEACVDGGERARIVGELYKSYDPRVFCFARRFARDEEAEEVAHEAFVRLFRVRNLERMSISVAYLLRIAENLLKRRHERAQRYRRILEESGVLDLRSRTLAEKARSLFNLPQLERMCDRCEFAWRDVERIGDDLRLTLRPKPRGAG